MFLRKSLSGTVDSIGKSNICNFVKSSLTGRIGISENIPKQWALSWKNFIHSGNVKEFEAGGESRNPEFVRSTVDRGMDNGWSPRNNNFEMRRSSVDPNMNNVQNSRSANFGRSFLDANAGRGTNSGWNPRNTNTENGISTVDPNVNSVKFGRSNYGRSFVDGNGFNASDGNLFPRVNIEKDGDIVHMKMLRNNCFITVTDSNGNKKFGSTTGRAEKGGGRIPRFSAEAVAEQMGREARERGIKSVVIKIDGVTYFTRKKKAILSFREGYSHSRLDRNPIVFIEDTTRRAHNGCRLPKKRRV